MIADLKPYPVMKDSGVQWLGEVPEHWEQRSLWTVSEPRVEKNPGGLQLLSVFLNRGVIRYEEGGGQVHAPSLDLTNYQVVHPGDFVLNNQQAWRGSVGVSRHHGIVSPAYIVLRLVGLDAAYANYLFQCPAMVNQFVTASKGVGDIQRQIYWPFLRFVQTLLPPLSEQAAIVRFLDHIARRIRRYIRAKQKLVKLLEEQKQAFIHQAVTRGLNPNVRLKPSGVEWLGDVPEHWEVRRLRNATDMRVSNVDKHVKEGEASVRLCNYVDVYKNDYISEGMDFMHATATAEEIERFRLERGDVLVTKDSETWDDIGVPALVTEAAFDLISGYHLALLRPQADEIAGGYLLRVLQSNGVAYQFHIEAKGVTRYGLSHASIKSVWLPLPPLPEQADIVSFLDRATADLDAATTSAQRETSLLREYRTRLIADAVTGKLDVREAAARVPEEAALDTAESAADWSDEAEAADEVAV